MYKKILISVLLALLATTSQAGWNVGGAGAGSKPPTHLPMAVTGCVGTTGTLLWDTIVATAPTATCSTGTTNTTLVRGQADFIDTGGAHAMQQAITLPSDFTTTGGMSLTAFWLTSVILNNATWTAQVVCTSDGMVDDVAWDTAVNVTSTAKGTANQLNKITFTFTGASMASCSAKPAILHIRISRDGAVGSDTLNATASITMAEMTFNRQ